MARFRLASLAMVVSMLGGCAAPDGPVDIRTNPVRVTICALIPQRGQIVADPTWGLALAGTDRLGSPRLFGVVWPKNFSARRKDGMVQLMDERGWVIAREGDHVVLSAEDEDPLRPCPDVQVPRSS